MKKYIQICILFFLALGIVFQSTNYLAFAQDSSTENTQQSNANTDDTSSEKKTSLVYTTTPALGAECRCVVDTDGKFNASADIHLGCGNITNRLYECKVEEGMAGFQNIFKTIVLWVAIVATLLGVLALVALGIAWAIAGGEDSTAKKFLKEWIQNIIIGLLILYTFGFILRFLAPWVYT